MKNLLLFLIISFYVNICFAQVTETFTTQQSDFTFTNDGTYDIIEGDNSLFTEQIGAPYLPIFTQSYLLPAGSIFTGVSSTNVKSQLSDTYYIYPTQPPCPLNGEPCPDFVEPDPAIYNSTAPFPDTVVEVVSDNHTYGYHLFNF